MKIALLQMTAGLDPAVNVRTIVDAVETAARGGAGMLFTPEMSNLIDRDRTRAATNIVAEDDDPVVEAACVAARDHRIWVHLGSVAVRRPDGRYANRGLIIDDSGIIRARYDKLHLFDVDVGGGNRWRESAAFAGGEGAVVAATPAGPLGLSICYDIRFPALYQALSAAGARVLAVPAAFTRPTGEAHWEVLLRARAIENACFTVAAAQSGEHADGRHTHGHSLVVDPWGRVLLDMGDAPGIGFATLDPQAVVDTRARIPVLDHRRDIPPVRQVSS